MEKNKNIWSKWLYWFIFAVAVITVYKTLDNFKDIVTWFNNIMNVIMPFLIGIFIAYILYIPCKGLEKIYQKSKFKILKNKARGFSIFTVYLILLLIIILAMNFIIPTLSQSVVDLVNNIGVYYNNTIQNLDNIPQDSIIRKIDMQKLTDMLNNLDIQKYISIEAITQYVAGAIGVAKGIFNFFVSIIVSVYILLERTEILNFIKRISSAVLKNKAYKTVGKYFSSTNSIFFKFVSSQILDAIIVGILTSIAMLFLDIKYAILLGVLIGLSNLIPYFGAIIGIGLTIIITIFTGGIGKALILSIVVIILQQIDANIINPKIVGNSLKISPLLVIFAVTIGGAYFGVIGMFLSVPVFAVLKLIIEDFIDYKEKNVF